MPGETAEAALDAGERISASGRGLIFTQLGEAITRASEADSVRDHYLSLFDYIRERKLPAQVSVKPTQLGLDLSHEECERRLHTLAAKAEATASALWLDMEDASYVDRTLDLYSSLKIRHPHTGIALQAYLYRTPRDVERLLPLKPIIRLVKGAYDEPAAVAFPRKSDTDRAYEEIAVTMLDSAKANACTPIFGTHDMALAGRIALRAQELGVGKGSCEVHMLYGIRDSEQQRLAAEGHTVKTLISYGASWYKWYMRRLAERPANVWFVVRSIVA